MKAIETRYKGYRFRSRLEARWAVFFDTLELKWEYEKEGFDLEGVYYLPDFWLPELKSWIEIKPGTPEMSKEDQIKALRFDAAIHRRPDHWEDYQSYYILAGEPYFDGQNHAYVVRVATDYPGDDGPRIRSVPCLWAHCPLCDRVNLSMFHPDFGWEADGQHTEAVSCMYCDCVDRDWNETKDTWFHKGLVETRLRGFIHGSPRLMKAYNAARSARFEHGENGSQRHTRPLKLTPTQSAPTHVYGDCNGCAVIVTDENFGFGYDEGCYCANCEDAIPDAEDEVADSKGASV